jgi:hypothetical protein
LPANFCRVATYAFRQVPSAQRWLQQSTGLSQVPPYPRQVTGARTGGDDVGVSATDGTIDSTKDGVDTDGTVDGTIDSVGASLGVKSCPHTEAKRSDRKNGATIDSFIV